MGPSLKGGCADAQGYKAREYHKPLPEAMGAIVAGVVLGWLALRTRSIWGGVLLHVAVALSMDALALWRAAAFPQSWF